MLKLVRATLPNYLVIAFFIFCFANTYSASATSLLSANAGTFNYSNGLNGQAWHEYLQTGNAITIPGNVTQLKFVIAPDANLSNCTSFYVRIWRLNSTTGNYTCVGSTPDLKSQLSVNLNTIDLVTPIPVQPGDVYGFGLGSTGGYLIRMPPTTGLSVKYVTSSTTVCNVGDSVNWTDSTIITDYGEKLYKIDFYGDSDIISVSSISPVENGYIVPINEEVTFTLDGTFDSISSTVDGVEYSTVTNTNQVPITFSEGEHTIEFDAGAKHGVIYVYAYDDISQVSPYLGNHTITTPTLGKSGTYLQGGNRQRIRQNGEVRYVGVYLQNTATLEHFSVQVWRRNAISGNYTLVSDTGNLTLKGDGYNLIPISGLTVQEGDYYGFSVKNSLFTLAVDTSTTGATLETASLKSPMWSSIDFDNATQRADTTFRIDIFEDCPDIITIGDSHISGFPAHRSFADPQGTPTLFNPASSIAYQLSQLSGWSYQNMGYSGQRSDEIRARFEKDVIEKHPKYVIVEGGFNDYKTDRPQEDTIADLTWMIERAREENITPISFNILPTNSKTKGGDESNMTERDYINNHMASTYKGIIPVVKSRDYVGLYNSSGPAGNLWDIQEVYVSADKYHYNTLGYTVLAAAVYKEIIGSQTLYMGEGINSTITPNGCIGYSRGLGANDTLIPFAVSSSGGNVTLNVTSWSSENKTWLESSETHNAITSHTMGGFEAGRVVSIKVDGVEYKRLRADSSGYIAWIYDGGFSEHTFSASMAPLGTQLQDSTYPEIISTWGTIIGFIILIVLMAMLGVFFGMAQGKVNFEVGMSIVIMGASMILIVGIVTYILYIILSIEGA